MNIFEFAEKYKISVPKTRKIAKDFPAIFDGSNDPISGKIKHYIGRSQPLSADMLCRLVEHPSLIITLDKYADTAQSQVDALRNPKLEIAPPEITAIIGEASKGEADAVHALTLWLQNVIPAERVMHSYIGVRLLLGVHVNSRQYEIPRIPRALLQCRKYEQFAGWWSVENFNGRNTTFYQRPKKPVAKFDL